MPRSRETAMSATTWRAAKYRFHGTVTSTISQARATPPAPMASSVASGTPARRPSQANSRAAAAPVKTMAHQMTGPRGALTLMRPSWAETVQVRIRQSTQMTLRACRAAGQHGQEGPGDHERAERDVLPAVSAAGHQQAGPVDGAEQEPGEGAGDQRRPAGPGRQGAQAGGQLGVAEADRGPADHDEGQVRDGQGQPA